MKYDEGKADMSLIPPGAMEDISRVFMFGAEKYGRYNWRMDGSKTEFSRTYASVQRHLNAYWAGEDEDPESGLSHLAHAMTQLIILMTHSSDGHSHMDDRYIEEDME